MLMKCEQTKYENKNYDFLSFGKSPHLFAYRGILTEA
jgi:hypothetical protein